MAYQGGWGGGQRGGNSNWGGGGGRGRGYGNQRGGGGGGGRHAPANSMPQDWREAVKADRVAAERPRWELSCYGHEREAPNDVSGDVSPEEVRWANMLSAQRGASMHQLASEFKAASRAKVEQILTLQRAQRPPSKGGPPLPPPTATISGLEWVTGDHGTSASMPMGGGLFGGASASAVQPSASPFGAPTAPASTGGFGQSAFGAAQQPLFGQPAQPAAQAPLAAGGGGSFGQPAVFGAPQPSTMQQAAPAGSSFGGAFGAPSSGGFGGTFGSATTGKMAFGQQQQQGVSGPSFGSTPFGGGGGTFPQFGGASTPPVAPSVFGGGPFGAPSAFGSAPSTFGAAPMNANSFQSSAGLFGQAPNSPLGSLAGPAAGMFGQPAPIGNGMGSQGQPPEDDPDAEIWKAPVFEKGKIPERAPPAAYCR